MKIYTKKHGILNPGDSIKLEKNLFCLNYNAWLMIPPDLLMIKDDKIYGFDNNVWDEGAIVIGYYYK